MATKDELDGLVSEETRTEMSLDKLEAMI